MWAKVIKKNSSGNINLTKLKNISKILQQDPKYIKLLLKNIKSILKISQCFMWSDQCVEYQMNCEFSLTRRLLLDYHIKLYINTYIQPSWTGILMCLVLQNAVGSCRLSIMNDEGNVSLKLKAVGFKSPQIIHTNIIEGVWVCLFLRSRWGPLVLNRVAVHL